MLVYNSALNPISAYNRYKFKLYMNIDVVSIKFNWIKWIDAVAIIVIKQIRIRPKKSMY